MGKWLDTSATRGGRASLAHAKHISGRAREPGHAKHISEFRIHIFLCLRF